MASAKGPRTRPLFEELDWCVTPLGTLSLRRRAALGAGDDVYEVKLGDAFLMSSRFTVGEVELAKRGLAAISGERLDIVVGGLGLGHTADAVLRDDRVRSMLVVEALPEVIGWARARTAAAGRGVDWRSALPPRPR